MTAIGTVAVAVVAVGVALFAERRADKRVAEERKRSATQIAEERRLLQDREEITEAYAVQVVLGERSTGSSTDRSAKRLVAIVKNHGRYTITHVEARLRLSGAGNPSLVPFLSLERVPGIKDLDDKLLDGVSERLERIIHADRLKPWDLGLRFESDPLDAASLQDAYAVVRWMDRWKNRWEQRLGEVQQIQEGDEWQP
jgi:hypothetical protein